MSLDRFELDEEIGRGALGRVVKARERPGLRPVALRIIEDLDGPQADALVAAAERAAAVDHPHVVRVLSCGREGNTVWLAMELLSGRTLAQVLEADGPFPADRLVQVGAELCAGLEAHHRHGLVHRDLKPANVLVTRTGVKILDVGLAHARACAGTAPYGSPEMRYGYPVDERSDLYSLGVLLFELLTGARYTFDGGDAPLLTPDRVPPPIAAVVLRLLHQDSGARFRNAAAVAEALREAVGEKPRPRGRKVLKVAAIAAVGALGVFALVRGRAVSSLPAMFIGCAKP